jgi:hypothetical protein
MTSDKAAFEGGIAQLHDDFAQKQEVLSRVCCEQRNQRVKRLEAPSLSHKRLQIRERIHTSVRQ